MPQLTDLSPIQARFKPKMAFIDVNDPNRDINPKKGSIIIDFNCLPLLRFG